MHLSKHKRMTAAGGAMIAAYIALCPHLAHRTVGELADNKEHIPAAGVSTESHHDHEHCEFDAMHSHDFLVPASVAFKPVLKLIDVVDLDDQHAGRESALSSIPSSLANLTADSLKMLDTIRLRI